MLVKINGKTKDVQIKDVTAENFIVQKGEERYYHVKLTKVDFNKKGKDNSKTYIKKFAARVYESPIGESIRKEYDNCEVLHNPKEWLENERNANEARKSAQIAQAQADADAKAIQDREALKASLKAEIMAEMKAETKTKEDAPKETK